MQTLGATKPPVGVVFDSDFGNSLDSALALALLHGFDSKNELRIVSISVSKSSLKAAAFCDAVERFYGVAPTGPAANFFRPQPIGLATGGKDSADTLLMIATLDAKKADGKPAFPSIIHQWNDTADPAALIRNALTAQYDGNAIVVLAGPATNLVRSMALPGVRDLIATKVRCLVLAAGQYPSGPSDQAIAADIPAAQELLAHWPSPIVAVGREVGSVFPYPAVSFDRDFAWAEAHPIVTAYRALGQATDVPARDLSAVLYAARPNEECFQLSEPGRITVGADGRTDFSPGKEGRHKFVTAVPAHREQVQKLFAEYISAKPVPKQRFPRRPDKVEEKPKAAEPAKL